MSSNIRQANLFAAEDFEKIYKSYKNVNFKVYDFDGLKRAMVEYLVQHYPEDFNDYIESSEYIALIELLAMLSTSLGFRQDLNARNNFIDTAERRESIVRLAQMVNYQPKRNFAARGMFKLSSVRTNEPLLDSLGNSLQNKTVFWNDANNIDSYEQFSVVLNSAMKASNPFGKPVKRGTVAGVLTDLYQLNNVLGLDVAFGVSIKVNGEQMPFEIVNVDFDNNGDFFERHPDPENQFHMLYRNDTQGLGSANTGFFLYFKQGTLERFDNVYDYPVKNRTQSITATNINETDVYVQEIDSSGLVKEKWNKIVYAVGNENVFFNSLDSSVRKIYSVSTGLNDTITLQYADGNFGEIPVGVFRTWIRKSANKTFALRPNEAKNLSATIPYFGKDGQQYNLTLSFGLEETVNNSVTSESNADIKLRAPSVYYTQDRMVNNEDYNVYPLSRGNEIVKVRTINRTHAGHSRYIDINDPTGFHQNIVITSDDGVLFKDNESSVARFKYDVAASNSMQLASVDVQSFIKDRLLTNFFYDTVLPQFATKKKADFESNANAEEYNADFDKNNVFKITSATWLWSTMPRYVNGNTGVLKNTLGSTVTVYDNTLRANHAKLGDLKYLDIGAKIKFVDSSNSPKHLYATVLSIVANSGSVEKDNKLLVLDNDIPNGYVVAEIYPVFRTKLTSSELLDISSAISSRAKFGLSYALEEKNANGTYGVWKLINGQNESLAYDQGNYSSSWLVSMEHNNNESNPVYTALLRGVRYLFGSDRDVRFYIDESNKKNFNVQTLTSELDTITVLPNNLRMAHKEYWRKVLQQPDNSSVQRAVWQKSGSSIVCPEEYVLLEDRTSDYTNTKAFIRSSTSTGIVTEELSKYSVGSNAYIGTGMIFGLDKTVYPVGTELEITYSKYNTLLGEEVVFNVLNPFYETENGLLNTSIVEIIPADSDLDGVPDEPFAYQRVVDGSELVFFKKETDSYNTSFTSVWSSHWKDLLQVSPVAGNYTNELTYLDVIASDLFLVKNSNYNALVAAIEILAVQEIFLSVLLPEEFESYTTTINKINNKQIFRQLFDAAGNAITSKSGLFDPMMQLSLDLANIAKVELAARQYNATRTESGIREYVRNTYVPSSLYPVVVFSASNLCIVRNGRSFTLDRNNTHPNTFDYKWDHVAPTDHRIDPSVSNLMDMIILTNAYYSEILSWKDKNLSMQQFPKPPTSETLRVQFSNLNNYKMMSDTIVYHPAAFKVVFGKQAPAELQAKFNVVKLPNTTFTDNEIKTKVVDAINQFFSIAHWDFGETFYFTEMASFIHKQMPGVISSILLVPMNNESKFGDLFEIRSMPNELFVSTVSVTDINIVNNLNDINLRA